MAGKGKQTSAERRRERAAQAQAAAIATRRRRRLKVLGGLLAAAVLIAGTAGAAVGIKSVLDDESVAASPTVDPSESPTTTATPTPAPPGKASCFYLEGPGGSAGKDVGTPPRIADAKGSVYASLVINGEELLIELDQENAPCTVNSFVHLAKNNYYDDTPCHRELNQKGDPEKGTIDAFVLQCGDPGGSGRGGPGYTFADENLAGANYSKGVVAMANSGPNSNGSQFFMIFGDSDFPPNYTPFGRIISGIDVLTDIAAEGVTGPNDDEPKIEVKIEKVTISKSKPKS